MTTEDWRVLALPPMDAELMRSLFGGPGIAVDVPQSRERAALLDLLPLADIVIGDWTGGHALDVAAIDAATRLRFVQQPSAGVDKLDVAALTEAGIPVSNIGDANAASVAEWCVGATFAVLRSLTYCDQAVRQGEWPQVAVTQRGGGELVGRRVGIVGMGNIGVEAAKRYVALGCDVAHWSRRQRTSAEAGGAPWLPLDELLAHAQVLVVIVALAPETRGLIGVEQLKLLPPDSIVINAARGGIVDETALFAGIDSGQLAGAGLDVFDVEPLPADSPLRHNDRIVLSPHAAGSSPQSISRLVDTVIANVKRAVGGEPVRHVVNGIDPIVRRHDSAS